MGRLHAMGVDRLYREFAGAPASVRKERAKERLGRAINDRLRNYFRARVDEQLVADLVQEANETIWTRLASFEPVHDQALERWMLSIARILVLRVRYRRVPRAARVMEFESAEFANPATGPSTALRRRERSRVLESELRRLATPHRLALVDQLAGGDVQSFAAREGLPSATVRSHRRRGRRSMEARVARRIQSRT
ncbi:hypothetical protein PPSIR1_05906 [Plesiocystis pacifica SIR-1]|uniref:Uncharacterized protein n=2 Tax=Plesiocystis pacifica TaxID=191768 RepID=A6G6Q6_9BACT|nr:hypothetical protein PPSIR1_05906 [Plesiocystis pacifica SIR-1]